MLANEFLDMLRRSPTCYHSVENIKNSLEGYELLQESGVWNLQPGGRYCVTRNGTSLIAFTMPHESVRSFQIVACHDDSPTFKIKEMAELKSRKHYVQLDVEPYGGSIYYTWLDRPLSVAGRVVVRTKNGVTSRLVDSSRDVCIIPSVPIHMNRSVNEGTKLNPAVDLMPLWGAEETGNSFGPAIAEAAGVALEDILSADLFLVNRTPGCVWGTRGEYMSAGRLDDMECTWAAMKALIEADAAKNHVNMIAIFDNEEVGSHTRQGAGSTFMSDVLHRISAAAGHSTEDHIRAIASSFMLSADNAHAVHPNHPELYDPVNRVVMNGGVVVKTAASQKYASDALAIAVFRSICERAGVPVQYYANRSDLRGGSTLGNISGSQVSLNILDIGAAQLAMHSSYETAGTEDLDHLIRCMAAFFRTEIISDRDGEYRLE